ncbi:2-(3-amino-3-carboxypropyl)histidine synthase subunit 2 [Chionoecetes opilio]|uniref:2-(3-amino-3-carboxypropyl)histidine synthase subunit 2 n=1 Tax=Chionoecetes opilio TaxID=41210 RepID=A0A8J4YSV4_CHIOP|nr:2-(3-amino-3-carboxypropyl)histidine synthase subunit 2 [Chionoecetes opilio]
MSAFTNTGSAVVQRQVVEGVPRGDSFTLEQMYEVTRCVAWVRQGDYHKVCLQFPDELLGDAAAVAEAMTCQLGQPVYILGDTTYGSCCVDEVAAAHVGADAVIHFGNTCLSRSQRLPVLYIPTRLQVDIAGVMEQLKNALEERDSSGTHPLILLYDTRCQYAVGKIFSELSLSLPHLVQSTLEGVGCEEPTTPNTCKEHSCQSQGKKSKESNSNEDSADVGHVFDNCSNDSKCNCCDSENCQKPTEKDGSSHNDSCTSNASNSIDENSQNSNSKVKFNGRCVLLPSETDIKDCSFIYLGPKGTTLDSLLLRFADKTFYHVPLSNEGVQRLSGMQSLFRRNIKLEIIRDASIIGILVGTLGVAKYQEAIARLKSIIKCAGKRSYTFVVGKPNEPKLANISEVDVYVYVTCPETTLVDRASDPILYRKLVAPWEVEVALVAGREWSMNFESDFSALLPGGAHHMEVCKAPRAEEASVSLITNQTQTLGLRDGSEEAAAGPVVVQEGRALAALHVGGGGQILGGRSWAGLDPTQPPPAPSTVVLEGRKGIAAEYQDEKR